MKLISLKVSARGSNGWESPLLEFGNCATSLYAPNGSGKTPILQALMFALGYDSQFRDDIQQNCKAVLLNFERNKVEYDIYREIGSKFYSTITSNLVTQEFFKEEDFSQAMFHHFQMDIPILVSSRKQAIKPYMSTLLPIFYVRQDGGYSEVYSPPSNFISNQFVEMIRFAFRLTPKRSYTAQRDLIQAKEQLELQQKNIVFQNKVVLDLASSINDSQGEQDRLTKNATILNQNIIEIKESIDASGAAYDALSDLLQTKEEQIRTTRRELNDLQARLIGIDAIRSEIDGEIKTLSLNEESRRIFESAIDICSRPDCGLFVTSSDSYAKNLMYLKDQIKDLDANTSRAETHIKFLENKLAAQEYDHSIISSKIKNTKDQDSTNQLISSIQSITKELIETEQALIKIDRLKEERAKQLDFENRRIEIQDRIATLENNARSDLEFNKLRLGIRDLIVKWMNILNTPNTSREVDIDLNFGIRIGSEPIRRFTGSTRSRLILAVHAAIFEQYLQDPQKPFRFLILDTPKQHELNSDDLSAFLTALQEVCKNLKGQILFSATEYRHPIGSSDIEWTPQFPGKEQLMYLGSPN